MSDILLLIFFCNLFYIFFILSYNWVICKKDDIPKTEIYICEMLPLETKQSGDKLLPHSELQGGSVSRGNIQQQALQQEGTAQLQDWNVECRTLNQGGKLENLKKEMKKNEVSILGVSEV
jgi:hypothetical protein